MTVSCVLQGGLGNNFFILATVLGYSFKHNCDYAIPTNIENPHYPKQKVFYSPKLKYLPTSVNDLTGTINVYYETQFHYKPIPKMDCDYLILQGYFQSNLFFQDYRNEILELLDIPYYFNEGAISLQIRRGDYLNLPNCHPVITLEYIHSAIDYFRDKGYKKFIIFSDDMDYAYSHIEQPYDCSFEFSEGRTEIEDLILASSCEHSIGSNSSYAWWIYWLNQNKNKIGVFPQKDRWFAAALPHNVENLYMPEWVLI